jgi:hypothetical protein
MKTGDLVVVVLVLLRSAFRISVKKLKITAEKHLLKHASAPPRSYG